MIIKIQKRELIQARYMASGLPHLLLANRSGCVLPSDTHAYHLSTSFSQIPKSIKGTSCSQAMDAISRKTAFDVGPTWAETKYDGERAQIHVQLVPGSETGKKSNRWKITIYSKSGRDSTLDRAGVHE